MIARRIVQYLMLAIFLLFFLMTRRDGWSPVLVDLPTRLDPLVMLANLLASRTFLVSSSVALITILITLVFGRAWCGWICPLGTTLDLFSFKRSRGKRKPPSENWRNVKYVLLIVVLTAALFGNLTLLALDPLTILFRSLTVAILPALYQIVKLIEGALFQVPALSEAVAVELGQTYTNGVVAAGTPPLAYQWFFNDQPLTGKTNRTIAIPNIQSTNAGAYSVTVTSPYGSTTSRVATLFFGPGSTFKHITNSPVVSRPGVSVAGFWGDLDGDGWVEKGGRDLEFTVIVNQGNAERLRCAEMVQKYLKEIGVRG